MKNPVLRALVLLLSISLLSDASKASAQSPAPTGKQAAAIFAILIGVPVLVGYGVYRAVRAPRNVTGCVAGDDGSLLLTDEKGRDYLLTGDTAGVHAHQRVRLTGKASKDDKKRWSFAVNKVSHDYGGCQPTHP